MVEAVVSITLFFMGDCCTQIGSHILYFTTATALQIDFTLALKHFEFPEGLLKALH